MKVFAIGDLHLSGNPPTKPMDIFGPHWNDHWARIKEHWNANVSDEDIVFLVGDMSWALRLEEAACDLQEIASLPGKKYMIRGNHDYWWASANKMHNLMGDAITFIQGHGTAELIQTEEGPIPVTKLLLLHYPPFNESNAPSGFTDLLEQYKVDICIFGHLHDQISFNRIPKEFSTTKLELVSADYLDFKLKQII
ncbi:MAG: metallophosphoesterase [Veillonella sp.]|nr:metallophosphoesterase [Veillonella sp.]